MSEENNTQVQEEQVNNAPVQETVTEQVTNNDCKPPKKKRNGLFTLFACIMTAIIVVLAMNIGQKLSKTVDNNNGGASTEEKTDENSEEKKEENDNTLTAEERKEVNTKYLMLLGETEYTKEKKYIKQGFLDFTWYVFDTSYEEYGKSALSAIINVTKFNNVAIDKTKLSIREDEVTFKNGKASVATLDEVNKNYKYVFGKDIPESAYIGKTVEDDYAGGCSEIIHYDRNLKMFIYGPGGCGGVGYSTNALYMDDIVKENGDILVKVYVGHYFAGEAGETFYTDYVDLDPENPKTDSKEIKVKDIDESNKTSFPLYNFVFKKASDGNYYFDSVKKAS